MYHFFSFVRSYTFSAPPLNIIIFFVSKKQSVKCISIKQTYVFSKILSK
jgi:hypothetical protein